MPFLSLRWYLPFFHGIGLGLLAMAFHEAAHIVVAMALGVRIKKIGLGWKGMYTVRDPGPPEKNLLVSLAGPLVNMALTLSWHWFPTFALANMCCWVANILPIQGADGDRALTCWQQMHRKDSQD